MLRRAVVCIRAASIVVMVGIPGTSCLPTLAENPPRDARSVLPDRFSPDEETLAEASVGTKDWRDYFASPALQGLVDEALHNNQELNIQLQELVIGRAEVDSRYGDLFPKVGAGIGAGIEKVGGNTSQGAADLLTGVPEHLPDFGFGLHGSWEVDIWGKLRDATSAASARYRASVEARHFMVTQLVAEIARSYYELVAFDGQIDVVERNIDIQRNALAFVRVQKDAARVTQLAVQRFEAEVLKNRARLFDLQQQRSVLENRINFLVGRPPRHVERDSKVFADVLPTVLDVGVPSALLKNRPDVKQAELRLEATKLDVNVARANFYPALSIDADLGYNAFNLLHLLNTPESIAYNLAGNLAAPLLNRQAIEAQYRTANALQIQAVFSYEKTVLQAFTDVANQLVVFKNLRQSYELTSQQVDTLQSSIEVSNVLFQSARADYMEVLLTRRDALDAELELIETKKRVWQSTVDLYQALGGGWRDAATTPESPTPGPTTPGPTTPESTTPESTTPESTTPAPTTSEASTTSAVSPPP